MKTLKLSTSLELPANAATQKFAFLGRTGSGKTYASTKFAECLLEHGDQIVALDPVGVWYGLRQPAKKGDQAFEIPVFGGLHGDLPLEPAGGALVAELIVSKNISAVVDVSQFMLGEQRRFSYDFATAFFQLKKKHASPVHLFIEEAQEFVPQNIPKGDAFAPRMLGAFERLIKLGRNFGCGASLLSQRPQSVNKDVLNQTECLLAFQMTGPHERDTIKKWIAEKGINESIDTTLPHLAVGQCHIWSPQWLKVSKEIKIAKKITADVSSTPEFGEKSRARELTPVDIEALKEKMAATIERAKSEDPAELRGQIAVLNRQIQKMQKDAAKAETDAPDPEIEKIQIKVVDDEQIIAMSRAVIDIGLKIDEFRNDLDSFREQLRDRDIESVQSRKELKRLEHQSNRSVAGAPKVTTIRPMRTASSTAAIAQINGNLPQGERAVLTVCAQYPEGASNEQITILTGYKRSTRDAYVARLREKGYVERVGSFVVPTQAGVDSLGPGFEPLPTGPALVEYWQNKLPAGERKIFDVLLQEWPKAVDRDDLGNCTEFKRSTRDAYISRMDARRIIDTSERGRVKVAAIFFE